MLTIKDLNPSSLWQMFEIICSIPHPSKHEINLREHINELCLEKGLETIIDKAGNLIIKKTATLGMEKRQTVVLQGHIDMVPQKNSDSNHIFETDPIKTYVDGEWLKAKGTTLGSDNGIGVAAGLAIMFSDNIPHGSLEMLCTIEEETSMKGAFGLEPNLLNAQILLNLDTEDEGELYVGCAGGVDINATIELETELTPDNFCAFEISVRGLLGGHSGLDIDKGRGNANKIINRFLMTSADELDIRVASFNGGTLRNAIPRESFTIITLPKKNCELLKAALSSFSELIKLELGKVETNFSITSKPADLPQLVISKSLQSKIINAVAACVTMPFRMSSEFEGVVETSNNLAIVKSDEKTIKIQCLTRSLVNSARDDAANSIAATFKLIGANTTLSGAYPGWKPNPDSKILVNMINGYKRLYGKKPAVKVIHAGLECGLLGQPYPDIDMISFGPTIRGAHSPDERCHIPSVQKFWDYLLDTLANIPNK